MSWQPLVIMVAPNGARKTKVDHPEIPLTPDEIGRCAAECKDAGAAAIHMHVRKPDGSHLLDAEAYRDATAAVRRECGKDIVIQVTTEAVGIYKPAEQMQVVRDLRPEHISAAVRELARTEPDEQMAAEFYAWADQENIKVQHILYSDEDVHRFFALRDKGVIPEANPYVLYVLGRYTVGQKSEPSDLLPFLSLPGALDVTWGFCAFGPKEGACAALVASLGGHARVGFENNTFLNDGAVAPNNAALVSQVRDAARAIGRPIATADQAREILS